MQEEIKVLVVDDAAFMRKAIVDVLASDTQLSIVGTARNGQEGLEQIKALAPDVITLDIDMPIMDGLTSIRHIMIESPAPIVVLSSLFSDGAITFDALRLGVVDFIPKPSGAVSTDIDQSRQQLIDRIKLASAVNLDNIRRVRLNRWDRQADFSDLYGYHPLEYLLTLGTTLSGPNTVIRMLANLPPTLPTAVVAVQEISPKIIGAFVKQFDASVPWRIREAQDGMPIEQGTCYISSYQNAVRIQTNTEGAPCLQVLGPSEDPLNMLFASAAEIFQQNTVGVLLTGIGHDGAEGFSHIRELAGVTLAQDTQCCVYPNLTHNAIQRGTVDIVLDEIELPQAISSIMAG
ncbi:MAG: chemotaxis protein CheB [Desulfobacterales bacterium]|nr:chemotaxis protein CheB [Desulfobacterales bacterium]MDJ0874295.1 chemotaxis protein CheB [Desulfobacterales bacterium]